MVNYLTFGGGGVVLQCYLPLQLIKASFWFKFSCPQVASEDYNECFMFNLPCTDIFLKK